MEPNQPSPGTNQNNNASVSIPVSSLRSIPFILGVLLFFAPFIDIRCNNVSLQQVSGVHLATGFEIKNDNNSLFGRLDHDNDFSIGKSGKEDGNIYALIGLIAGVAGVVISFMKFKEKNLLGVIAGAGSAVALIGLMIDIRSQIKADLSARSDGLNINFGIDFTPWFYIAILSFVAGAFLSYKGMNRRT